MPTTPKPNRRARRLANGTTIATTDREPDLPPISFTITNVRWSRDRRGTRKQRRLAKVRRMQRARRESSPWLRAKRLAAMQLADVLRYFVRDTSYPQRYNPDVGP